ncbi:MAG TPA: DUF1269 domain-containing protein [Roseiflexaceae bacterium]|nr:DUF1269 domain-containing protein [Roseiflexaceae bacterium]
MSYEFFLTAFDRAGTAGEAASWLHEWVRKGELQVLDVVVLAKREDGSALIRENGDLGSQHAERIGAIVGGLLGAPGGPVALAALGAAGAALGAAGELLASRGLYYDDLKEFEQALAPGTSALLALLAPEHAASYARHIADFGGETMRFSMTNDSGQEFQHAKHAFIARQSERRREQLAAWSSTTAEQAAELHPMNHELQQLYAAISSTPERQQAELRVQAAALRTRRDAARQLLNQTLAAAVQRLDEEIARYQEALSRATSEETHAALATEYERLLGSRVAAEQQLAASQDAELHERRRDITALQRLAARADRATRITLDMQLAELRDLYAVAREARSSTTTRPVMNAEPAPRIIPLGAQVECMDGYGGSVTGLIVDPLARRLTHIVVRDYTVPAVDHLVSLAQVAVTTEDRVRLGCSRDTLAALEPFADERYIRSEASYYMPIYAIDSFMEFEAEHIPLVTEQIPPGELAIQDGAQILASDGPIGEVSAFVVEGASGAISAIVVRVGDGPTSRKQTIPIREVERIGSRTLSLRLARGQVARLPARSV